MQQNIPLVKLGLVAVSRDCFLVTMAQSRRNALAKACQNIGIDLYEATTIVESENDIPVVLEELQNNGCNSLVVYLGNFGPEAPETILLQEFGGPAMAAAAAEEKAEDLMHNRGDAFCGMLNCAYNLNLRGVKAYIPAYPVGTPAEVAAMIEEFVPVARALLGLASLKVISFGPRPQDFFACNAPIKALYSLGIEVQENSELDLLAAYKAHAEDLRIPEIVQNMEAELGKKGNTYPALLPRMAQYELTLLDWAAAHKGRSRHVVFANKCWPAFPAEFGFEPCYVNSRLAARGIPVACEVDIYGAVSEYIAACASKDAVTLLDINNTVPPDLFQQDIEGRFPYSSTDVFMGFHCGNTPLCKLSEGAIRYQLIQNRLLENGAEPDFTRGTLEGDIRPGPVTLFRLHSNADTSVQAYIAQGEVLPVSPRSFGSIGIFALPEMARFYRHVHIEQKFPHHSAVAFSHIGKTLWAVLAQLGISPVYYNQPQGLLYPSEMPF